MCPGSRCLFFSNFEFAVIPFTVLYCTLQGYERTTWDVADDPAPARAAELGDPTPRTWAADLGDPTPRTWARLAIMSRSVLGQPPSFEHVGKLSSINANYRVTFSEASGKVNFWVAPATSPLPEMPVQVAWKSLTQEEFSRLPLAIERCGNRCTTLDLTKLKSCHQIIDDAVQSMGRPRPHRAEPVGEAAEKAAPEVVAEAHDPTSTLTAEGDGDGGGGFETRDVTLDRFQPRLQLLDSGSRLVATRHDGKPLYPSTEAAAAMAEVARFVEAEAEAEAAEAVRLAAAAAEVERLAVAAEAARLAAVVEEARVMMGHLAAGEIQEMLHQPTPAPTAIDWQAEMLKCIAEGKLPKTAKNLIPYSIMRSTAKMGMKDPIIFAATPQALGSLGVPSTLPDRRAALQILRTLGEYICLVDPAHVHKFQYHPGLYMSKRRCMSGSNKPQRANWFVIAESSVEAFKAAATHNKLDMMTIALSVAKMDKARRSAEPKSELAADEEVDSAGSKRAKLDGACANLDAEVEMQDVHAAALSEEISRLLQQLQAVEAKLLASEKAREAAELGIERGLPSPGVNVHTRAGIEQGLPFTAGGGDVFTAGGGDVFKEVGSASSAPDASGQVTMRQRASLMTSDDL